MQYSFPSRRVKTTEINSPFTVAGENEAGVDLVLIQPFLLYYVNHVFLMLTSIFFSKIYIRKGSRLLSKQGQPQPHVHSKARTLSTQP